MIERGEKMENAAIIMEKLEEEGHKTYIVGGAVRDKLLGLPQKDIDLVTLAQPEDVCRVAENNNWSTRQIGRAFGVVMVIIEGKTYEVASARRESYGEDSHRPEKVSFVADIEEDLARRDLTINAMAMDSSGKLIDPFGGRADLERKIIRTVGDPHLRFEEDGLRPFRAVRFAAELGFTIDNSTLHAISSSLSRVKGLSVERVAEEIRKILLSLYPGYGLELLATTGLAGCTCTVNTGGGKIRVGILEELLHLRGLEQNPRYHSLDAWQHTLAVVEGVPRDLVLRWAALLHDVGKGTAGVRKLNKRGEISDHGHARAGSIIARNILSRLRESRRISDRVVWLVDNHMSFPLPNRESVLKWLRKRTKNFTHRQELEKAVRQLFILWRADMSAGKVNPQFELLDALEKEFSDLLEKVPLYPADLAINGKEIAAVLGPGPQVRFCLNNLLKKCKKVNWKTSTLYLRTRLKKRQRTDPPSAPSIHSEEKFFNLF